jgi:preprotein translocase subunit SecG
MYIFIVGLHIVVCLFLILVVLLQPGKGADFGAAMGGASQNAFSGTATVTVLGKITGIVAALFMGTSLTLAWYSNKPTKSVFAEEGAIVAPAAEADTAPAAETSPTPEAAPVGDVLAPVPEGQPAGNAPVEGGGATDSVAAPVETAPAPVPTPTETTTPAP